MNRKNPNVAKIQRKTTTNKHKYKTEIQIKFFFEYLKEKQC